MFKQLKLRVNYHPSGSWTLTEAEGDAFPKDANSQDLRVCHDQAKFYRAVAKRIAEHNLNGIIVTEYIDITHS